MGVVAAGQIAAVAAAILVAGFGITSSAAQPAPGTFSEDDVLAAAEQLQQERPATDQPVVPDGVEPGTEVPADGAPSEAAELPAQPEAPLSTDAPVVEAPAVEESTVEEPAAEESATTAPANPLGRGAAPAPGDVQQAPADGGGISVMSVPRPTGNNAVITVKVGGQRSLTSSTTVSGIPGVTLRLSNNQAGTSLPTRGQLGMGGTSTSYVECTSDADGDCNFVIPQTSCSWIGCWLGSQANRDRVFWIIPVTSVAGMTPTGFYDNATLATNAATLVTPPGQTGSELRAENTYRYTLAYSRNNPVLLPKCPTPGSTDPLRVALLVDLSGSVGDPTGVPNQTGLTTMKTAARGVLNTLAAPGSTAQLALYSFAGGAPANTTNNANVTLQTVGASGSGGYNLLNDRIGAWTATGGTNWDAGLYQVATVGGSAKAFDLVIVITDGMPTFSLAGGSGSNTTVADTGNAVFSANALKDKGTRTLALGVGSGVTGAGSAANLRAISGATAYNGSNAQTADYFQTSWTSLAPVLQQLTAGATCQSTVEVTKMADPFGSAPNAAANGWTFTASHASPSSGNVPTIANAQATTAGTGADTGKARWIVQHSQLAGSATVVLTEAVPTGAGQGWALQSATCTVNGAAAPTGSVTVAGLSVSVTGVKVGDDVKCTVNNVQSLAATMTIEKRAWSAQGTGTATQLPAAGTELATGQSRVSGSAVTFSYTVRNSGTAALTGVVVTDDRKTDGPVCTLATLAVGATSHCYWTPSGGLKKNP